MQFCVNNNPHARNNHGMARGGGAGCFNCGDQGHKAADCPLTQQRGPPPGQFPFRMGGPERMGISPLRGMSNSEAGEPCIRCGQRGHRSVECPSFGGGGKREVSSRQHSDCVMKLGSISFAIVDLRACVSHALMFYWRSNIEPKSPVYLDLVSVLHISLEYLAG